MRNALCIYINIYIYIYICIYIYINFLKYLAIIVFKTFLTLIDKHFPKNKRLSKIFNRNTIKSATAVNPMLNRQCPKTTTAYYRIKESTQDSKLCNCQQKNSCQLDGKCLTNCDVYKATTETTSNNQETYIGLTKKKFMTRFNFYKSFFK